MADGKRNTQDQVPTDENPSKDFISCLRPFEPPPKGFDPSQEKNSVLVKHGYPARPSSEAPLRLATWEKAFSQNPTFIAPTFLTLPSVPRAPRPDIRLLNATMTDPSLCGAFLPVPASGTETEYLTAVWTIPKAYPPRSAHTATGLKNGTWSFKIWLEIEGVLTKRIGTTQQVVVSGGRITSQTAYAWIGTQTGTATMTEALMSNFPVGPGDVINGLICQQETGAPDGGTIGAINVGDNTFTSTQTFLTSNSPFIGTVAKWMVEVPAAASKEDAVQFGSVVFSACTAGYGNTHQMQLGDALLFNTVSGTTTLLTATVKGSDVVVITPS